MSLEASELTGMGSAPTAGNDPGGTIRQITSTGGTVTITNPTGPIVNLEVSGGGLFPGYGGAPPAVASTSAGGAAGTASRSDHTHSLDLVAYNPSLVGMQAAGMHQQTYGAPTATPSLFTATAQRIPFGALAATGLLQQSGALIYNETATLSEITMGATNNNLITFNMTATNATNQLRWRLAGVTFAALAATAQLTAVGNNVSLTVTPQTAGTTSDRFTVFVAGDANPSFGVLTNTNFRDGVIGTPAALATGATGGFVWLASMAAPPSGVPNAPATFTGSRTATVLDPSSNTGRWYAYVGGAWHFSAFDDYSATTTRIPFGGATTGTLTDEAAFNYVSGTNTLTVDNVASNAATSLTLNALGASSLFLSTNTTVRVSANSIGDVTMFGSGGAAPGGTYGNMLWTRATSTLTLGQAGGPPAVGSMLINTSTGSGLSVGGGITGGLIVRDAGAGGEAILGVDSGVLVPSIVGWQSGSLTDLRLGVAPTFAFTVQYNSDRLGAGTNVLHVDGSTGTLTIGAIGTGGGITVDVAGNAYLGLNQAWAAGDTVGFPYMPKRSGAFTGAPAVYSNGAPFALDRTHQFLQIYDATGAAWLNFPSFQTSIGAGAGVASFTNVPAGYGTTIKYWGFTTPAGVAVIIPYFTNP